VRAEGVNGAAVAAVMRDTGLTHGGFYKHFESKDDLLLESLSEAFRDIGDTLIEWPNSRTVKPRGRRL
jgi:TetR/AcrR family transcriptional repressor of nem operon